MQGAGSTELGFLGIGMALMGLTFGPMSAVLPESFPTNVRYTGSGISYNISSRTNLDMVEERKASIGIETTSP